MTDPTTPLAAAVAVFRDLGWADASPADALTLPLGDRAQRATAKRGVAAGAWGAFGQIGPRTYGWVSAIGVDAEMFTLFALRQGVPARRAAVLLRDMHRGSIAQAAAAAAEGGDPGAVVRALFPGDGGRHWTLELALRLLAPGDLAPPSGLAYLRAWASFAETHLIHAGGEAELARWRFAEHARAAVAAGVNGAGSPEAGAMALVLARGVELELIGREEAIELGGVPRARRRWPTRSRRRRPTPTGAWPGRPRRWRPRGRWTRPRLRRSPWSRRGGGGPPHRCGRCLRSRCPNRRRARSPTPPRRSPGAASRP